MPVSSYVLRCAPEDQPAVRKQLNRLPGIEVGQATDAGIPVAAVTDTSRAAEAMGEQLQNLRGVRSAILVYHNFEDVVDETSDRAKL